MKPAIKGISKLPSYVQSWVKKMDKNVTEITVEKVPMDEMNQPDISDTIRIIGWGGKDGFKNILEIGEMQIGLPTLEEFWATYSA